MELVSTINKQEIPASLNSWEELSQHFNEKLVEQIKLVSQEIESKNFDKDSIAQIRNEFKRRSEQGQDSGITRNIKEFLCEAFCLIEIIDDISKLQQDDGMVRHSQLIAIGKNKSYRIGPSRIG